MRFTDEEMIEICRVRERLVAYRNKIQPYPDIPPEPQPAPKPEVWQPKQWYRVQQLEGKVNFLENKVTEMRAAKKEEKGFELDILSGEGGGDI